MRIFGNILNRVGLRRRSDTAAAAIEVTEIQGEMTTGLVPRVTPIVNGTGTLERIAITIPSVRRLSLVAIGLCAALTFSACAGDDGDTPAPQATIAEGVGGQVPAGDPNAEVAVCDLLESGQVAALLADELREPRAGRAAGNTLGRCDWTADNNGRTLSVWAWPIGLWERAIATDGFGTGPIEDLGVRAESTSDNGLLVDPGNRHYYLQVFVIDTDGSTNFDLALQAAELLVN